MFVSLDALPSQRVESARKTANQPRHIEQFAMAARKVSLLRTCLSSTRNTSTLNFVACGSAQALGTGDPKLATALGEKIRAKRKELKLTLDQLAEKTESSKSYIWELENRPVVRPSADKIGRIAEQLGVTVEYLLDDEQADMKPSDVDAVFFRKIERLDPQKRAQLEKFLKAIDDE
jgi:transcriptional regulator with XRE-family HTH domain